MYSETVESIASVAVRKQSNLRRSFSSHMVQSMLAGMYVGVGIALIFCVGAPLAAAGSPFTKLVMGASFGVALTLVVFAGAELFTGNAMVFAFGSLTGKTSLGALAWNWLWTWIGNLIGSVLFAFIVVKAGTFDASPFKDLVLSVSATKMSLPWTQLILRGVLANWLVCLALWQSARTTSEAARLGLIFWCLFAFIGAGWEHSIANMSLLSMGLFLPHEAAVSIGGFARNLAATTLGNAVGGGVLVGFCYWYVSRDRKTAAEPSVAPAAARMPGLSPLRPQQEVSGD